MHCCRQQDEELDELSASVQRIGGVGLTIHEELIGQVIFIAYVEFWYWLLPQVLTWCLTSVY